MAMPAARCHDTVTRSADCGEATTGRFRGSVAHMKRSAKTPAKRTAKGPSKAKGKPAAKAPAKRTAKAPLKREKARATSRTMPNANELQNWEFMTVLTGSMPATLTSRAILKAIDELVAAGVDDHELLAWNASDDNMMLDDDGSGSFTMRGDLRTAQVVRFGGRAAVRAGFGALAIGGLVSTLPADVVASWPVVRAKQHATAEVLFRTCELLVLGDRPELERAWSTGNVAAWRYALAIAQDRPLMAKHWQARMANG
jgi:hypothetical protein